MSTLVVAAWLASACGSSEHPSPFGVAGSSNDSVGGSAALQIGNGGGNAGIGNSGGITDACAADVSTAEPVPLDMYIMLDVSTSMLDATTANISKWRAVTGALEAFLSDSASAGLGVGLQYFPLRKPNAPASCQSDTDCGDTGPCLLKACFGILDTSLEPCTVDADCVDPTSQADNGPCVLLAQCSNDTSYVCPNAGAKCQASGTTKDLGTCTPIPSSVCENVDTCAATAYAAPAAAIATLPAAASALLASINAKTPDGNTPTAPALTGAIQQASAWAKAHTNHRVVAVLATDGLPTECTPTAIDSIAGIAAAGVKASPSISTFVIGVFNASDVANGAPANLNEIANQGGTGTAFIVDTTQDVTQQFLNALDDSRRALGL